MVGARRIAHAHKMLSATNKHRSAAPLISCRNFNVWYNSFPATLSTANVLFKNQTHIHIDAIAQMWMERETIRDFIVFIFGSLKFHPIKFNKIGKMYCGECGFFV